MYAVKSFSHGVPIEVPLGIEGSAHFTRKIVQFPIKTLGEFTPSDITRLPLQSSWVDVSELRAKGDGHTDCTDTLITTNCVARVRRTLWVTDGGGGVFKNLWIHDVRTKLGFCVSETKTPGKVYEMSVEHHKDVEVELDQVDNWSFMHSSWKNTEGVKLRWECISRAPEISILAITFVRFK